MHRHRLVHLVYWSCVVLLAGGILPFGVPVVLAAPAAQIAPGSGYVPRPATIRRLPGRRVLRIVADARRHDESRRTPATVGESRIGLRTSGLGEEGLPAPVISCRAAAELASEINMPVVCVLAGEEPVIATVLGARRRDTDSPRARRARGAIEHRIAADRDVHDAGRVAVEITAPVERVYPITVPPLARPAPACSARRCCWKVTRRARRCAGGAGQSLHDTSSRPFPTCRSRWSR